MNGQPASNGTGAGQSDFARVEISSPFDRHWMEEFLASPERALRINSQIEFASLEKTGENDWHMAGQDLMSGRAFDVRFRQEKTNGGMRLVYDETSLKSFTEFAIKPRDDGTVSLVVTDDYSATGLRERTERADEVDKTIVQWGKDLHHYFYQFKRWSWLPGWKFYMRRVWQNMKPSARRISFLIMAVTAGEFILFIFVFTIFWLERRQG